MNADLEIKLRQQIEELQKFIGPLVAAVKLDKARLDWLDKHCSCRPNPEYRLRPYMIGELREMADAGMLADKTKAEEASLETMKKVGQ